MKLPSPTAKKRGDGQERRSSDRHRGRRPRNSHPQPRRSAGRPGAPVFRPASRPKAAKLPSPTTKKPGKGQERRSSDRHRGQRPRNSHPQPRRSAGKARNAGLQTGIAAEGRETPIPNHEEARERPGAPVFRPASRPKAAKLPSPTTKKRGKGQERRSSDRHRGQRPRNSHPQPRRSAGTARSAGLQTDIAARGRETPIPNYEEARDGQERRSSDRHRGQRPRNSHRQPRRSAGKARNAGLQTGIAAKGRETPIPNREGARERPGAPVFRPASRPQTAKLPSPTTKERGKGQERRSSDRRRGQRPRNSHPQPRRSAGKARSAGLQTGIAAAGRETPIPNSEEARERPGTPVFRPASRPQAAKLPSPTAKKRGKGQERQPPAGIARERETSADDAALGERTYRTPS